MCVEMWGRGAGGEYICVTCVTVLVCVCVSKCWWVCVFVGGWVCSVCGELPHIGLDVRIA